MGVCVCMYAVSLFMSHNDYCRMLGWCDDDDDTTVLFGLLQGFIINAVCAQYV